MKAQKFKNVHIFNLNYQTDSKILQEQDLIEIAMVVSMFTSDQIKDFLMLLDLDSFPSKYPIGLYKLLILYEEMSIFDFILNQEPMKQEKARIISQSFSYCLMINNPVLAVSIQKEYISKSIDEILASAEATNSEFIDPILHFLNEFSETNGGVKYQERMKNFECYLHLLETMINFFSYQQCKYFIEICHNLLQVGSNNMHGSKKTTPDQARPSSSWSRANSVPLDQVVQDEILDNYQNNILIYSRNPIKTCVYILHVIKELESKFKNLSYINKEVVCDYCNLVNAFMEEISDCGKVYLMLTDKMFNKQEVIDVIAYKDLQIILNSPMINRIVSDFWDGPVRKANFLLYSTAFREIDDLCYEEKHFMGYTQKKSNEFSIWRLISKEGKVNKNHDFMKYAHFFNYTYWKMSVKVRYILLAGMIIFITFQFSTQINILIESSVYPSVYYTKLSELIAIRDQIADTSSSEYASAQSNITTHKEEYAQECEEFMQLFYHTMLFGVVFFANLAENIQMSVFGSLRNKKVAYLQSDIQINLFSLLAFVYLGIKLFVRYQVINYNGSLGDNNANVLHAEEISEDYHTDVLLILGILLAVQIAKVLILFKASETFGPLGHILMKMLEQVKIFLFLMIGIIFMFLNAGRIMFYNLQEFSNWISTFNFLFSASLGDFDYDVFNKTTGNSVFYGYIFLTLYLIVSTVTLLNFLIATLTSVYDSLNKISTGLYMREIIQIRNFYEDDPFYSGLIAATPPLNLFLLPVYPFLVRLKSRRLNEVVNIVAFQYVFVIGICIFFVCGLISTPFAYIIRIIRLISSFNKERKIYQKPIMVVIADIVIFILFGLILLLIQLLFDCYCFAKSCYNQDIKYKYTDESQLMRKGGDKIEPEFLFVFMSFLYHYKMKVVPSKVLLTDLSKKLKISQQIRKLLFQNDRYLKNDSSEKSPTSSCRDDNKKRENPEFQSDLEMERLYNKEHYHAKVEQLLRTSSPSRVLKQYNILKLMVNNNSIPNISFAHKRNPLIDIQKEGDNKLDQNWHKRMSVSFRRDQLLVKDSEPQDVFYINDYFKTLEEFYYYKLFQNRIDEQPVDDKVKDYIEFIRENSNIDMPCHTTLVVIHSKCNYRVLKSFNSQKSKS